MLTTTRATWNLAIPLVCLLALGCTDERHVSPISFGDDAGVTPDALPAPASSFAELSWNHVLASDHEDSFYSIDDVVILPGGDVAALTWGHAGAPEEIEHVLMILDGDTGEVTRLVRPDPWPAAIASASDDGLVALASGSLLRYDADFELVWQLDFEEESRGWVSVAVDDEGHVAVARTIVTATFEGYSDQYDIELALVSPDGELQWAQRLGDEPGDYKGSPMGPYGLSFAPGGDLVISGAMVKKVTLGELTVTSETPWNEGFIARVTSQGEGVWIRQLPDPWHSAIFSLDIDAEGTIFAAAHTFDGPSGDDRQHLVLRYDPRGEEIGRHELPRFRGEIHALVVDPRGGVVLAGRGFGGSLGGSNMHDSVHFLVRYGPGGEFAGEYFRLANGRGYWALAISPDRLVAAGTFVPGRTGGNVGLLDVFVPLAID